MSQQHTEKCQPVAGNADLSSFYGALQKKYSNSTVKAVGGFHVYMPQVQHGVTENGTWNIPKFLNLDCGNISVAGDVSSLSQYCGNVVELNLAQNSIESWAEVFAILDCMPNVEFLNLSQNPLRPRESCEPTSSSSSSHVSPATAACSCTTDDSNPQGAECMTAGKRYSRMKKLVLNALTARLPLPTVNYLLETTFFSLQELYLSKNDYALIEELADGAVYPTLSLLQLNENGVRSWSQLVALGRRFTGLETLVLVDNPLTLAADATSAEADTPATKGNQPRDGCDGSLMHLTTLNISGSAVSTWEELHVLAALPCLADLRIANVPLVEGMDVKLRRQLLIASFPDRLIRLNGSEVSRQEREDAERAYLRHFVDVSVKPTRFHILLSQHGRMPPPLANVSLAPPVRVKITVVCGERSEVVPVKLRQTVADLKKMLQPFAGLPSAKFDLYHRHPEDPHDPVKLTFLQKQLYSLNVYDGHLFYIEPKRL